jgi:hypothetical protein
MKYKYKGTVERVFPSLGITVKPGDEFEAPSNFSAADVTGANESSPAKAFKPNAKDGDKDGFVQDGTQHERPVESTSSAPSDSTVGE